MAKRFLCMVLVTSVLTTGCMMQQSEPQHAQNAQKTHLTAARSLDMEQLCKGEAAHRYNTGPQQVNVVGFDTFQGSYELRGYTAREEGFTCSFDADGRFLHLSMR
ncbi:YsaB family lipoprotein [Franconibacter pulveris 601]|uniref:YsaB family lipoprotein n=1 Tax=Franconibacter pulveris TaxID=435910 RepID=UPI000463ECE0|nr:YsaB family lipoprotein [Franconibacter pulveris]